MARKIVEAPGVGAEPGVHASDTHNVQEPPARPSLRVLALNMCLLPAGFNFSGSFLVDGDDRKAERLGMLVDLIEDYDIVLLNEMWGCKWSSHHRNFIARAISKGFNVVSDPIGAVSNTGNMILSRMPLQNATSMVYRSTAGWQSIVSNGILYAATTLPDGVVLHLFTTHLQCTTAPPTAPAADDVNTAQVLSALEAGTESVRQRQLLELKAFMDRTICFEDDAWVLAGDLNIEGGSAEYYDMVDLLGRESLGAPDFVSTYNTESFLTPPGWRGVEYSTALDHVLTNLRNVTDFSVLADNISDHRGLGVTIDCPRPPRRNCVKRDKWGREGGALIASALSAPPQLRLLPSMVSWWPPPQTFCWGPKQSPSVAASPEVVEGGKSGRRRRRGKEIAACGVVEYPECKHEIAQIETAAPEGSKSAFLVRAAWSPGQLAARLLLPGACEFAGAVVQTRAFASLKTRLVAGAASPSASASNGKGNNKCNGELAVDPPVLESIPASQL